MSNLVGMAVGISGSLSCLSLAGSEVPDGLGGHDAARLQRLFCLEYLMSWNREVGLHMKPSTIVRIALAGVTILFAVLGFYATDGAKFFVASGIFGAMWWGWDLLLEHVFTPFGHLLGDGIPGGVHYVSPNISVDDKIRALERRLEGGHSRRVEINAAIRLAELHRYQKNDPERAREIIDLMKERYPDAPKLRRFEQMGGW